jgi:hypothetical protein
MGHQLVPLALPSSSSQRPEGCKQGVDWMADALSLSLPVHPERMSANVEAAGTFWPMFRKQSIL